MDERELLKERFKSAVSSTVKAISENFDLKIKFGSNMSSKKRSEEHTSELQSRTNLVCRLLLEKKK